MTRILLHTGFHKTGTTTVQAFLRANRERLAPHVALCLHEELGEASNAGRDWAERPSRWRLLGVRRSLRRAFARLPEAGQLVISRETLSGTMPGTPRAAQPVRDYVWQASVLGRVLVDELRRRFGPAAELRMLHTTRDGEAFLRSAWGHHIRATALDASFDAFRAGFDPGFDLAAQAGRIRAALGLPGVTRDLAETAGARFGPASAVIELLELPETVLADLQPVARRNPGVSPEVLARMREMNATYTDPDRLKRDKRALRRLGHVPA